MSFLQVIVYNWTKLSKQLNDKRKYRDYLTRLIGAVLKREHIIMRVVRGWMGECGRGEEGGWLQQRVGKEWTKKGECSDYTYMYSHRTRT